MFLMRNGLLVVFFSPARSSMNAGCRVNSNNSDGVSVREHSISIPFVFRSRMRRRYLASVEAQPSTDACAPRMVGASVAGMATLYVPLLKSKSNGNDPISQYGMRGRSRLLCNGFSLHG